MTNLFLHRLRYHCCCSKPISYLLDLSPNLLSSFSIFNKYDESLHPRNPVSLSANFGNVYFVFLPYFDRFWSRGTSVEAPTRPATITSTSTATIAACLYRNSFVNFDRSSS